MVHLYSTGIVSKIPRIAFGGTLLFPAPWTHH